MWTQEEMRPQVNQTDTDGGKRAKTLPAELQG